MLGKLIIPANNVIIVIARNVEKYNPIPKPKSPSLKMKTVEMLCVCRNSKGGKKEREFKVRTKKAQNIGVRKGDTYSTNAGLLFCYEQ